jgi:anti-anti-sigma factor
MQPKIVHQPLVPTPGEHVNALPFRAGTPRSTGEQPTPRPLVDVAIREMREEVVVHIKGEATVVAAGALDASLLPLTSRRPRLVTLDLSELRGLSALGMGVLVRHRRAVVRAGGRVRLALTLQPQVREALERADLLKLFAAS